MKITYLDKTVETDSNYVVSMLELLIKWGRCHANTTIGSGTHSRYFKNIHRVRRYAYLLGIRTTIENDAPRKGQLGTYLKAKIKPKFDSYEKTV